MKTAIVVLSAGNSSRLGTPKQLLAYKGKPLLLQVVEAALQVTPGAVVVVTGAQAGSVAAVLHDYPVKLVFNPGWPQGMASGIVAGVNEVLQANRETENILLAVCDQPYVSAGLFQQLLYRQAETGKAIVACAYAGTMGTPVLFTKKYLPGLLQLQGEEGAKKLVKMFADEVATVAFDAGSTDIDTMQDYLQVLANESKHH